MNKDKSGKILKTALAIFFLSGASGLIYEIVWLRMLSRVMGVTTYATAVILAAFMAGLAIGSYTIGKLTDKRGDLLKIYAYLQVGIALSASLVGLLLNFSSVAYRYLYSFSGSNMVLVSSVRGLIAFVLLLIPTIFMGGTLPVLAAHFAKYDSGFGKNFSLLYGLNTLGAVLGVLMSGFVTIGSFGEWQTIAIGVILNMTAAVVGLKISRETDYPSQRRRDNAEEMLEPCPAKEISRYGNFIRSMVLAAIFISGFTSLAYEVIWSRQLIPFLGTSIYAFSAMLAVFLLGLAAGSLFISLFVDRLRKPLAVFGALESAIGMVAIINPYLIYFLGSNAGTRAVLPVALVFPLTFFFGAIFPIATVCYVKNAGTSASCVGRLYLYNAAGNVIGSLAAGFFFISFIGSSNTAVLLGLINIALGMALVWFDSATHLRWRLSQLALVPVAILLAGGIIDKDPFLGVIEERIAKEVPGNYIIYYNKECVEGTVTSFAKNGFKFLAINGQGQTYLCAETKLIAHLPILIAQDPKKFLAICFGMGTTVRSAALYEGLDITAVELVPEVYKCFGYYHPDAAAIVKNPRVHLLAGDGRNFMLVSKELYDIISIDPSPPVESAGTVNLYSKEFLLLCREHLSPNGAMCLWFPFCAPGTTGNEEDVLYVMKTFREVFPNMTVWIGPNHWGLYLIGTKRPTDSIDKNRIKEGFNDPRFLNDMMEYEDASPDGSFYLGLLRFKDEQVRDLAKSGLVITDNNPYTEFPLWRNFWRKTRKSVIPVN